MSFRHTKKFVGELANLVSETQRKKVLDKRVHVFHIHPDLFKETSFEAGLPRGQYLRMFVLVRDSFFSGRAHRLSSLTKVNELIASGKFSGIHIYQKRGAKDFIVLSTSYSSMQTSFREVKKRILKDPRLAKLGAEAAALLSVRGDNSDIGLDIGHIGTGSHLAENTPAGVAAQAALDLVGRRGIASGSTPLIAELSSAMNDVAEAHSNVFTLEVEKDVNSLKGVIGTFVYTMPQSVVVNQRQLSKIERALGAKIAAVAAVLEGSPSVLKMVGDRLVGAFLGKDSITKTSSSASDVNKSKKTKKTRIVKFVAPKTPKLRSAETGRFTSPINIQNILNSGIKERVIANMGSPALNNRTGRFAGSVEVTNVSQSRAGMVSVFYTYMKNPYQTFEPGFRQGSVDRDPKALISRSVRELAVKLVSNKLRIIRV